MPLGDRQTRPGSLRLEDGDIPLSKLDAARRGPAVTSMVRRALLFVVLGAAVLAAAGAARESANPFTGAKWFVDPASPAARQVEAWRRTRPADAAQIAKISTQPQALWLTTGGDVYTQTR